MPAITLAQYFNRKDIKYKSELTDDITSNATELLRLVNNLLLDLGVIDSEILVSSGWRPASFNKLVPNAATRSHHISGKAIDLVDRDNKLDTLITKNYILLAKHGLWLEDPAHTPGWCHLDTGKRSDREKRIFKP